MELRPRSECRHGLIGSGTREIGAERDIRTFSAVILTFWIQGGEVRFGRLNSLAAMVIEGDFQLNMPVLAETEHEVGNGFESNEGKQAKPKVLGPRGIQSGQVAQNLAHPLFRLLDQGFQAGIAGQIEHRPWAGDGNQDSPIGFLLLNHHIAGKQ